MSERYVTLIKLLQGRTKLLGGLVQKVIKSTSLPQWKNVQKVVFLGPLFWT